MSMTDDFRMSDMAALDAYGSDRNAPADPFAAAAARVRAPYAAAAAQRDTGAGELAGRMGGVVDQLAGNILRLPERVATAANLPQEQLSMTESGPRNQAEYDQARAQAVGEAGGEVIRYGVPVRNPLGVLPAPGVITAGGRGPRRARPTYTTEAPEVAAPLAPRTHNRPPEVLPQMVAVPTKGAAPAPGRVVNVPVMGGVADQAAYPQYAEAYPAPGPPVQQYDEKKKAFYDAKLLTPEQEAFQKVRQGVQDKMDAEGYTPFFDPDKRFHVDPKHYPPNFDTTQVVPKKQVTIDKHMETIGSEESRERLRAAYARGQEMPNTDRWYAMGQLEQAYIKELGAEEGRKAFRDRFGASMSATTAGASPKDNFLMAHYGNYLRETGKPLPEKSHQYPFPVGGRYAGSNMKMFEDVADKGGFAGLDPSNPKRHNFAQNFMGNRNVATMDEQMTSLMTPGKVVPAPGTYGLYERVLAEEAAKLGVAPRDFQDVAWAGAKNMKDPRYARGVPMMETINESIERTHRLTGMPREEIVRRGLIRAEIPMYGVMGATGLGAIADQSREHRDVR
jgi:hypothetical protein